MQNITGRNKRRRWLLAGAAVLWMFFIWSNSLQVAEESTVRSSAVVELVEPLFQALHIPSGLWQFLVRKAAHMGEFAVLALLWSGSLHDRSLGVGVKIGGPLGLSILTAAADEGIQRFVPGRDGSLRDVCIDTAGALIAIGLFQLCARIAARRKEKYEM